MMKCPECGCKIREQEGYEEEDEMEDEMEGGDESEGEGELVVKEVDVPEDKEDLIKKKLMELGKMLASIK